MLPTCLIGCRYFSICLDMDCDMHTDKRTPLNLPLLVGSQDVMGRPSADGEIRKATWE